MKTFRITLTETKTWYIDIQSENITNITQAENRVKLNKNIIKSWKPSHESTYVSYSKETDRKPDTTYAGVYLVEGGKEREIIKNI